jgi:hypothetical protein
VRLDVYHQAEAAFDQARGRISEGTDAEPRLRSVEPRK